MMRRVVALLCLFAVGGLVFETGAIRSAHAQQVPGEVQELLDERGLTVEEARRRAQQLGIDLSNPEQAARRARELGIPEDQIQAILDVVRSDTTGAFGPRRPSVDTTLTAPPFPVLGGRPTIEPDSISVVQLPREVDVRVPLRSRNIIRRVRPLFLTSGGDTVSVRPTTRLDGSVIDGTWGGRLTIPADTAAGDWTLFVEAATQDTTVLLSTGRRLRIFDRGEIPLDSLRQRRPEDERTARDTLAYFGYDTFKTIPEAFLPSATGPVDDGYLVGPTDELRLTVWGGAEFQYDLQVDREGRITVPNVGQFTVAGKRVGDLRQDVKQWLSQSYAGLTTDPPTVFMDLTVTRVRPVQVFVLGEVPQPGGYTVSSFATVFNALYSVGGPLRSGSLRNIRVVRNGSVVAEVDVYDYLLKGYSPDPVRLQNNDYVFVPPRGATVGVTGAVKRPAYYEMKEDETFTDLIEFAGGLKPEAYAQRFHVERVVPFEEREDPSVAREVLDYNLAKAQRGEIRVPIADGDFVDILSIRDLDDPVIATRVRSVEVTGAVFQPGQYEITDSLNTVRDLIGRADGLTGDAYRPYAELVRVEDDLDQASRTLDLDGVLADDPRDNIVLRPGDSLHVRSMREMREQRSVSISGQVRDPGTYAYREGMTIRDLLFQGGGLVDDQYLKSVFQDRADLYREPERGTTERVIPFHLGDALDGDGMANRPLQPGDEIRVYPIRVEELTEQFIVVNGAVKDTGRYDFRQDMTLKDAILQANGFQEGASLESVEVTRMVVKGDEEDLRAETIRVPLFRNGSAKTVSFSVRDTVRALQQAEEFVLQHRDRVFVRSDPAFKPQETVVLRGEVRYPGEYTLLRDKETLADVVRRSGGILSTGYARGGRLIRGNEQVIVQIDDALRGDPGDDVILQPGDEIVIPTEPNTVAIRGNVANEGLVKHEPGRRVEYYLERAGGIREDTEAIFLTQASGATFRIKTGWFRRTPRVDDGAVIRVTKEPEEPPGEGVNVGQTISESFGILSSALTIIVLATRAFN